MPKSVKRKTEGTADDSAKKIREEKVDPKTDCDEIEGQNSTVKRIINFATCIKCIEGSHTIRGGEYSIKSKKSEKYYTFEDIIEHTVNFCRVGIVRKSSLVVDMIEVEVGYKKGIPLFNMLTFERYRFRNLKERMESSDTTFTCCILINGIQTCKKELQGIS